MDRVFIFIVLSPIFLFAQQQGVNLSLDEGFGSRYRALSYVYLGIRGDYTSISFHPAALNDIHQTWAGLQSVKLFSSLAQYQNFVLGIPLDSISTLALGVARFSGHYWQHLNVIDYEGTRQKFADYLWVFAYAKKWAYLNVGINFQIISRNLDQRGVGIASNASLSYQIKYFSLDAAIKGLIPSSVYWIETQRGETEIPELYLGVGYLVFSNRLYGNYNIAIQSQGLLQTRPKSAYLERGNNIISDPNQFFKTIKIAMEVDLEERLFLRMGSAELWRLFSWKKIDPHFGVGYNHRERVAVNYSYHHHFDLGSSHSLSLSISPWWNKNYFQRAKKRPYQPPVPAFEKLTPSESDETLKNLEIELLEEDELLEE